jgi:putative flavoprotein involved in K+ transport
MADLLFASIPYRLLGPFHVPVYAEMARRDSEFYARLQEAGFLLDFGEDGSGLFLKYLRRGSGYYIDVGASELVAQWLDETPQRGQRTPDQAPFGRSRRRFRAPGGPARVCHRYGSMNGYVAQIVSPEVADKVGKCWGIGSETAKDPGPWEGELRNMWKPTQQAGPWFHGGNLHQSRHYSLVLALQLKAHKEGIDTPVYKLADVHHAS